MKALLIPVGEEPREVEVEGLADLQELVGGHIDAAGWVFDDSPALYVNDEGKVNGMLPNRAVYVTEKEDGCQKWDGGAWTEGEVLDILYGPMWLSDSILEPERIATSRPRRPIVCASGSPVRSKP